MSYSSCRSAWTQPGGNEAALSLDRAFPDGLCEQFSLSDPPRTAIPDDELLARVLTSSIDADYSAKDILAARLTSAYGRGFSVIRSGASDEDILGVIDKLLASREGGLLIGAVVIPAAEIRSPHKEFCVYDTDGIDIALHGDVVGTFPADMTKSASEKLRTRRRHSLRDRMLPKIVLSSERRDLLNLLRIAGI